MGTLVKAGLQITIGPSGKLKVNLCEHFLQKTAMSFDSSVLPMAVRFGSTAFDSKTIGGTAQMYYYSFRFLHQQTMHLEDLPNISNVY